MRKDRTFKAKYLILRYGLLYYTNKDDELLRCGHSGSIWFWLRNKNVSL
jgi:hypothetical protein